MADDEQRRPIEGVIVPRTQGPIDVYDTASRPRTGPGSRGPYKFDAVKRQAYVHLLRRGIRRVRASEIVGVSYNTILKYMERDEEFMEAIRDAEMARVDEVEEALYREAIQSGNVTAQQVILYNRRSDEWADQRQIKARLEAAKVEAEERERVAETSSLDGLRDKLMALRERVAPPVPAANDVVEVVETEAS